MPQKCCFRQKKLAFLGKKCWFLVMVAPKPLIICLKTLENISSRVQHPENRVWGPISDHSGPKNTVLGQKMAFFGQKSRFLVMAALKPSIIGSNTLQNTFF